MGILNDNEMSLTLTKDPESQNCTKHIDVMHHYMQDLLKKGELGIKWIPSSSMLADGLIKAFFARFFKKHGDK